MAVLFSSSVSAVSLIVISDMCCVLFVSRSYAFSMKVVISLVSSRLCVKCLAQMVWNLWSASYLGKRKYSMLIRSSMVRK